MQSITWGLSRMPYRRTLEHEHEDTTKVTGLRKTLLDSLDLFCGSRGLGWNWSKGLHVPAHTRPVSNEAMFVLYTLASLAFHIVFYDTIHYHIQNVPPFDLVCPKGSSIFDEEKTPLRRYALSTGITFMGGFVVYAAIQVVYDFATLVGVLVFQQHPSRWPPVFDEPWKSTSLKRFWGRGWHQIFRHCFISFSYPFARVFGRAGGVIGAFLASGMLHYLGLWGMGGGGDWRMVGFFVVMGFGIILEDLWRRVTGKRVCGVYGWMWTMVWVVGWGNMLVDAWARKGVVAANFYPEGYRPAEWLFGRLSYAQC
ncbi:hypothetical protein PM082_016124 [Marasmius tenuissimus]|nr:hypothetical protein PM082_016124 [Marasmius tenuissimus]